MSANALRIARFLVSGEATVRPAADPRKLVLENGRGTIAADKAELASLVRRRLVVRNGERIALTESGVAFWRRHLEGRADFQNQHRDIEQRLVEVAGVYAPTSVNRAESPLAMVARRRDRDGRRFLSNAEFRAGERLRSDYSRGQLMPRLGANWQAVATSGRRTGERGSAAELTDAAIAARQRVENAVDAVGPELAGVLVDICCYLKGLETVERERGWPVRSAKVVLKSALAALARHYEPEQRSGAGPRPLLHWGTPDYRPAIK